MDPGSLHRLIRSLRPLAGPEAAGVSDAQLLERFVCGRDEAAFELLLWRHGPMVLGLCRRLLPNLADAEDAFQATFLILARKAGSIARREAVGSWLYRVAYRVARKARADRTRRARYEHPGVDELAAQDAAPAGPDELRAVLDEEVNRLPARQRAAFVLCCLEGKSGPEAARLLGCPPGTVSSRLTRARESLRRRLTRRGLAPAGVVGAALAGEALAAPLPDALVGPTLKAALLFSTGEPACGPSSARAAAHAEGVLRAMFLTRLKLTALLVLAAGFLAAGGIATHHALKAAAPPGAAREEAAGARPGAKAAAGAVAVRVVRPRPGGVGRTTKQPCTVQAFYLAEVHAVVAGVLQGQSVDIGTRVKKGQVLAQIDAPLLALAQKQAGAGVRQARGLLNEAQAKVAAARAEVQAAKGLIRQRQAELDSARATATFRQRELERFKELARDRAVTEKIVAEREGLAQAARAAVDAATAALANARAELEVKQSKVVQAEAAVKTAEANVEAAEIALEKAHHSLSLTRVVAPFAGVVTRRNYSNGDYLRAGEGAGLQPLLTIERTDRLRVLVAVPARDVPLTEPGVPVDLAIDALPGVRPTGLTVARIGFVLDRQSRTMRVEIDVPNPKGQLRPGMSGTATLHLRKGTPGALRLPLSCLAAPLPESRHLVYVVGDGQARRTPVRVGFQDDKDFEVLSGLKPTDLVVADPRGLKGDVVPVEVKEEPGPK
jgi:RND family efflux transporter MFP subunit